MRLLLVVNTSASSVTARARVVIARALSSQGELTVAETSRRGHAARLAQGAAADGLDAVIVLGGDGTLNEAANGLAGTATALGVLPGGSTNVFARTIGMTNDPIEATGELIGALGRGAIRSVRLGQVNGRYFCFHLGLGFDAAVVAEVERRSTVKRYLGPALFLAAAVSTWVRAESARAAKLSITGTGAGEGAAAGIEVLDGRFAICLKTDPYTFLGRRPLHIAPGTGLDTDLALVAFRRLDLPTLLGVARAALRTSPVDTSPPPGGHGPQGGEPLRKRRHVVVVRHPNTGEVRAARPVPYQVDGDYLGEADTFRIRCVAEAIRLIVP